MSSLKFRERELVALGAALACNCIPCIEYHIKEAHKAGLVDAEIAAAIALADEIRRVPAGKVLEVASLLLSVPVAEPAATSGACCIPGTGDKSCC